MLFCFVLRLFTPKLERENAPSFKANRTPDDEEINLAIDLTIEITPNETTTISNTARDSFEFYTCSVRILNTHFENCSVLGNTRTGPSGGALYALGSQTYIKNTKFLSNKAIEGGALFTISSPAYFQDCTFEQNHALSSGGAITILGTPPLGEYRRQSSTFVDCNFYKNNADQIGGVASLYNSAEAYFENCNMGHNYASEQAGAVYSIDSDCQFFDCKIFNNTAGKRKRLDSTTERYLATYSANISGSTSSGRGCGGIVFLVKNTPKEKEARVLYISGCCLKNNMVDGIFQKGNEPGMGSLDIIAEGENMRVSLVDSRISDSPRFYKGFTAFIRASDRISNPCHNIGDFEQRHNTYNIAPAKIIRSGNNRISSVPDPTKFVYAATPITKYPEATTKSHGKTKSIIEIYSYQRQKTIPSPSKSPIPTQSKIPDPGIKTAEPGQPSTLFETIVRSNVTTFFQTSINSSTLINTTTITEIVKVTYTLKVSYISVYTSIQTYIVTDIRTIFIIELTTPNEQNFGGGISSDRLILLVTMGFTAIFAIAVIWLYLWRHRHGEPSSESLLSESEISSSEIGQTLSMTSILNTEMRRTTVVEDIMGTTPENMLTTTTNDLQTTTTEVFEDDGFDEDEIYLNADF